LRLHPRLTHGVTKLIPFATMEDVTAAIPPIIGSGLMPTILEYIDFITMSAMTRSANLELGVAPEIKDKTLAYLVVVLENRSEERVEEDTGELAELVTTLGALDVYVLPRAAGAALIEAREKAFWNAKASGANDILDLVVPRAAIPRYLAKVQEVAQATGSLIVGCGHAGDGNVHLSVLQGDPEVRVKVVGDVLAAGVALGGAFSCEDGIGTEKKKYLAMVEDPNKLDLMRRIKAAFDPAGILNPGAIFD